ncbi:MAG: hypothetical protein FWB80_08660 [Defluviitaleaceae bacterium]|nr:hypothetical protein [Defluviitaleaceae bacterium]MCL2198978.1 hypothetical protein [Defluviitaleaceae bacterium]
MYISEKEAMDVIEISSWRNLSKDKFMKFLSLLPDLDKETQLRAIEQIPNIAHFIMDTNEKIIESSKNITDKNKEATDVLIDALKEIQVCFQEQLKREDLSTEDRMLFSEKLLDIARIYVELDKTNKGFLESHLGIIVSVAVLGLGIVTWIIGGRGTGLKLPKL